MKYLALLLIPFLAACPGTKQVYQLASTPSQYAKAVLLHHNAIGLQMAKMVEDPSVSTTTKSNLQRVYRTTVCSQEEISTTVKTEDCDEGPSYKADAAIRGYEAVRTAQTEGDLMTAIDALVPLIVQLLNIVGNE